jgi:hypothetical protein
VKQQPVVGLWLYQKLLLAVILKKVTLAKLM